MLEALFNQKLISSYRPSLAYDLAVQKLPEVWCHASSFKVIENKEKDLEELLEEINDEQIRQHLYLPDAPDIDLIIRTSGESRLSGFLLWQSAYSEFVFQDVYWPEFRKIDFLRCLREYVQRERRFGK